MSYDPNRKASYKYLDLGVVGRRVPTWILAWFLCFLWTITCVQCMRAGCFLCGLVSPRVREFDRVILTYSNSRWEVNVHSVKPCIFGGREGEVVTVSYHCLLFCLGFHWKTFSLLHFYFALAAFSSLYPKASSKANICTSTRMKWFWETRCYCL